jgi:hypothetical protein
VSLGKLRSALSNSASRLASKSPLGATMQTAKRSARLIQATARVKKKQEPKLMFPHGA